MKIYKPRKTKGKVIAGHKYLIGDNIAIDLTMMFGEYNEPTNINDKRIKDMLNQKQYVSYDGKYGILNDLSWLKEN